MPGRFFCVSWVSSIQIGCSMRVVYAECMNFHSYLTLFHWCSYQRNINCKLTIPCFLFLDTDIIRTLYEPEAFLSLCNTSTRQLFDKLLLALQPLAILPFNLDYQFEHNHIQKQASAVREKQQLLEKYGGSHVHRQGSLQMFEEERTTRRFSFFGKGAKKDFTRSNSWTSSLSSSLGFGKTFAGQCSGRGQTQSSEQSAESDRLLRTVNTPPSENTTYDIAVSSTDSTPTSSTQSWSLDWIKSFVAASDQSESSKAAEAVTTPTKTAAQSQSGSGRSSWGRFGAR